MYCEDKADKSNIEAIFTVSCWIFSRQVLSAENISFSALNKHTSLEGFGGNVWRTHHIAFLSSPWETQCCKCTVQKFQISYFPHAIYCLKRELRDLTVSCGFGSMRCLSAVSLFKGSSKHGSGAFSVQSQIN